MPILHWLNKEEAVTTAKKCDYRLLEEVPELSYGDSNNENLLIQGDNLEALKALLPFYAGKVKCVYIDPPYNTNTAFTHYDDNLEHSLWLSMIYPRLELLRELMDEIGTIWVSVDENEYSYLKLVLDEIFGRDNCVETFIWKKSYGGGAKARFSVGVHEYLFCYAKNKENLNPFFSPPDPDAVSKYYKFKDSKFEFRGPYRLQPLATNSMDERPNLRFPIMVDNQEIWPEKQWQWSEGRVEKALENDDLVFSNKNGKTTVAYKQYLRDESGEVRGTKPKTIIDGIYTQHGTKESVSLFGVSEKFSFPKPEFLIKHVLEIATNESDLFLDSFQGSGTSMSVAQKMNRRYIGVEIGEHAKTHCQPRLQKVVDGEQGGISKAVNWQGGGGFRFCKLGSTVFDEYGCLNPEIRFPALAAHIWYLETKQPFSQQQKQALDSPFLGEHKGVVYYLLYNGILGDRRPQGGNVLTSKILDSLPDIEAHITAAQQGKMSIVVYGESTRLGEARLQQAGVQFKQIPYDVGAL